jgi:hypothetical protein
MVICLQIPTISWIGGRTTTLLFNVHNVSDVRQIEVHMAEPLVPGPNHLEVEIAIAKFKKCKSPGNDQILQNWFRQEAKYYIVASCCTVLFNNFLG